MSNKIAIFSPNQNAYSETFIQAHRKNLLNKQDCFIYGKTPYNLSDVDAGPLIQNHKFRNGKILNRILGRDQKEYLYRITAKALKKKGIDVALVEYGNHAERLGPILDAAEIPYVVHFHGYDAFKYEQIQNHNSYKQIFERAAFIIVVSEKMREQILSLGCPEEKVVYNVYGAQKEFYSLNSSFDKHQIISVGRFVDKKAPYFTLLAFSKVLKEFPSASLVMAGDGKLKLTCQNLAHYLGIQDHVSFPGVLGRNEVMAYYENSYCYMQHSIVGEDGDREGTPVAIMEAALAGLPVVSTNHSGIPDVIENGKGGYLVEERDVDKMADCLISLLKDKELAQAFGTYNKEWHFKNYSIDQHIDKLLKVMKIVD